MKILILKPSSLGDVIHALPVLRLLRRHRPEAQIFWWIESSLAPLLEGDPDLTALLHFERRGWSSPRRWLDFARSIHTLRQHAFDWVIDLQSLARSGIVAWLANSRLTIGLDDPREGARALYDYAVPRPSPQTHAVDWYLQVLPCLGLPIEHDFDWMPERPEVASRLRQKWPLHPHPWITLLPGARWDTKRWPVEHFSSLVQRLHGSFPDLHFAVLGSRQDETLGAAIQAAAPARVLNLAGQTSLPEMIEWIRSSLLVVSNDTGPMHVAAALRKPVFALFGPTDPHRTGPYQQLHHVFRLSLPCAPCLKDHCSWPQPLECLRRLSVDTVCAALEPELQTLAPPSAAASSISSG